MPEILARALRTTNPLESKQGLIGRFSARVKNWSSPEMMLRWHSAACEDAERRMHRVFGAQHLDLLRLALRPQEERQRRTA